MTREEAIYELLNAFKYNVDDSFMDACNMAIEALQAEYEDYEHATLVDIKEPLKVAVVRCKNCRHRHICSKNVRMAKTEACTVSQWGESIDYCSHGELAEQTEDYSDLPDIPRAYYERVVHNMAHEINMLKDQIENGKPKGEAIYDKDSSTILVRPHGRWEFNPCVQMDKSWYICSECGHDQVHETDFCPGCGARMDK